MEHKSKRHPAKDNGKLNWVMECGNKLGKSLHRISPCSRTIDNNSRSPAERLKRFSLSLLLVFLIKQEGHRVSGHIVEQSGLVLDHGFRHWFLFSHVHRGV